MSARNRCLCQSRLMIWLLGLVIQLKRGGLAIRRVFIGLSQGCLRLLSLAAAVPRRLLSLPASAVHWLWTSLFWPVEESQPVCPKIAPLETPTETQFESPTRWEQLQRLAECSVCALRKTARVSRIKARRAGLHARRAFQLRSAWTFATVTGTLGIFLMVLLQLMYSFQTLGAKESPESGMALEERPKTRIDPGFPQSRGFESISMEIAQTDPYVPATLDPFAVPPQEARRQFVPPRQENLPDSLDELPPYEPLPVTPISPPPIEEEPFVDPLDNLPPFDPAPQESQPPAEPVPDEFPPFQPTPLEPMPPQPPENSLPEEAPRPPIQNPPTDEPNLFIDPLDNLPPYSPVPLEEEPPRNPVPEDSTAPPLDNLPSAPPIDNLPSVSPMPRYEPVPFVDPLDTLPPYSPLPPEEESAPEPPRVEPETPPQVPESQAELGVGILRLPKDDEARFLSESEFLRNNLSREVRLDAWDQYLEQERPESPRPYWERLSLEDRRRLEQDLISGPARTEYDPGPEPAQTELNVGIEKRLPPSSTTHEPLKYEIIVENRGREMIDAVDVDEAVPPSHQLTEVIPAGYFERNMLRWRLREIQPGEKRRLSVEVVPSEIGTIETTTKVRPSTRVSSLTQVEENLESATSRTQIHAVPLRLRRSGYRTVSVEESVLFTNHVQNLSNTTQRDVEIVEQVPAGFRVIQVEDQGVHDRQTNTITWTLAALPAGETAKLGVHLQAESTGELMSRVKGVSREGEAVPIRARVQATSVPPERIATPRTPGNSPGRCSSCGSRCCCPACCCR